MTVRGVVVKAHLCIESMNAVVRREDERVDLDEVGVAFDVAAVQVDEHLGGAVECLGVETGLLDERPRVRQRQPVERVDVPPRDRIGILLGDLLDVDTASGRDHGEIQLGRPVEGEARVVLLRDVCRVLYPEPLDYVALDVEAEDVARVKLDLGTIGGELDAACLPAPTDLHLRLHYHGIADPVRGRDRILDGVGNLTR